MAKNRGKEYATMSEDERDALAGEPAPPDGERGEVDIPADGPREADRMGRHYGNIEQEYADPDNRDGQAAELDMAEHERRVAQQEAQERREGFNPHNPSDPSQAPTGELDGFRVAMLATDGFEESELTEPRRALLEAGAEVDVVAPKEGSIQGFQHHDKSITVEVDRTLDQARPAEYDAVMLPGGALNADAMRVVPGVKRFLRAMQEENKPFAVICHAPWELISAGLVEGRRLTGYHTIQDDIKNAGGDWQDQETVVDRNWVTSRQPSDIPAFNREMINLFAARAAATRR
ncbi:MAG TPA: type 1 glutamine amidotransferase domain-containing protein [Gemmatimonadales bacterium]|nr:type 1 glutamine amidotransferase domain-containing protein [Gemmatimonadales bacterium]